MPYNSEPLRPQLEQAQKTLIDALTDACSASLSDADTGELIRIEEVLAIANEAAKEVISVRRRLGQRSESQAPVKGRGAHEVADVAAPSPDDHREIEDAKGVRWVAFAVYPSRTTGARSPLPASFQRGWLAFDSGMETRRLTPIPEGWHLLSNDELCLLCEKGEIAPRRPGLRD
ncbi:MAG: hypothetical protein JWM41_425 [Gemmatimonadetes bacterium]|nr:hypothetical protein [Gemmatimonadota bacterium]